MEIMMVETNFEENKFQCFLQRTRNFEVFFSLLKIRPRLKMHSSCSSILLHSGTDSINHLSKIQHRAFTQIGILSCYTRINDFINHIFSKRAAVVAQWSSARLKKERLWVQIPSSAGLFFSLLCAISSASLIQVPCGGATLLIFL